MAWREKVFFGKTYLRELWLGADGAQTQVTATAAELNIMDGVTATYEELNILDGVTATYEELNILDGVTATYEELNILDGVTATYEEINILDGVTATYEELNLVDNQAAGVTWTVGAEAANVINVAGQITDAAGNDMATVTPLDIYLATTSAGTDFHATGVDSWAIGTDGSLLADGGDSVIAAKVIPEADGDFDIDMTHVGAETVYCIARMPNGSIDASDAITFDADT